MRKGMIFISVDVEVELDPVEDIKDVQTMANDILNSFELPAGCIRTAQRIGVHVVGSDPKPAEETAQK